LGHGEITGSIQAASENARESCDGDIKKLKNDFYGEIEFDPKSYPNRIGLIIVAHNSAPYVAAQLVPELLTGGFPIHVFSLNDFAIVASRFDTAGNLITFLEMRGDVAGKEVLSVQKIHV